MLFAGKLNKFRTFALLLIFIGILIMYIGLLWRPALLFFLLLGSLCILASFAVYIMAGALSNRSPVVVCPRCGKHTKVVGMTDECMYCKTTLTFDPKYAPTHQTHED